MTALKKQKTKKINRRTTPQNRGVVFCVQKSNESRYFYKILIEIYKRTLFSKRKFAIILTKEAVTEAVRLRYKYRKESLEC